MYPRVLDTLRLPIILSQLATAFRVTLLWRRSLEQHLSAFMQCVSGTASLSLFGLSPECERDWIVVGDEGNSVIAIQHPESQQIDSTEKDMVNNPLFSCVGIVGDLSKSIIRNVFI